MTQATKPPTHRLYGNRTLRFKTINTIASHWKWPWARSILFQPSQPILLQYILSEWLITQTIIANQVWVFKVVTTCSVVVHYTAPQSRRHRFEI